MPPFASSPISQVPYPALYLYPLNDSFIPKHISLVNGQRVKIGRQTNAKTVPAERNGYFDSKVLSRQHAEVWEETGKIFIKDVKSSNGTFINSERLSAEGLESEPFELKNEDIVEFGIDIVGEDNKTIVHHKVAARVLCILNEQDAQNASRLEAQHQQNPPMYSLPGQGQGVGRNGNAFNFAGANQNGMNGVQGLQRGQVSRGVDLGGMGGNARQPMKGGITFQDLLSRLQGELQKSRETGSELTNLQNTMGDIHDTLGGNLPMNNPPYAHQLPPVVPPQAHGEGYHMTVPSSTSQEPVSALSELQSQLRQTQESLANHVDKIRSLEGMLAEHESIKREVSSMRDMMEERKREMELLRIHSQSPNRLRRSHSHVEDHDEGEYIPDDDDDARSVGTVVPHELERVDEEDEEQIAAEEEEEERRRRRDELGRPRTPEPTGMGMGINEDDEEHEDLHRDNTHLHPSSLPPATTNSASSAVPDELILRMTTLASQLESALELSRSLEAQHATAQSTISSLETKVAELESLVKSTQTQVQVQTESQQALAEAIDTKLHEHLIPPRFDDERERETLKEMFIEWKKGVEGQWSTVQEEWSEERDRMRRAKEEVDVRLRTIEDGVGSSVSKVETGMATLVALQAQLQHPQANGSAKPRSSGGLVTPPSPRSLSSASTRTRHRKRRSSSGSGHSSRSASPSRETEAADEEITTSSPSRDDLSPSTSSRIRHRLPWMVDDSASESEEPHVNGEKMAMDGGLQKSLSSMQYPITPEPSLRDQPVTGLANPSSVVAQSQDKDIPRDIPRLHSMSTVAGVLILSVAAAAVIWRVKPETAV